MACHAQDVHSVEVVMYNMGSDSYDLLLAQCALSTCGVCMHVDPHQPCSAANPSSDSASQSNSSSPEQCRRSSGMGLSS